MIPKPPFRADLEGLRAVAVALVVLYHARVPFVTGGYVGVDVFFVLSGFLITGLLIAELSATGRVDFPAFYARRVRRLLPASALTLVVTITVSAFLLPAIRMPHVAGDTVAAGLYVSNMRFALQATDYLGSTLPPSPVLHFWSLGVEEQFYLVWPALLALAAAAAFRAGRREAALRRLGIVLGVVLAASLAFEVWLTDAAEPWAFFSLPARAWELALGGLLAVPAAARLMPRRAAPWIGWGGLALIVLSGFVLTDATVFPGLAVLLPTVGSALVIAAGLPGVVDGSGAAPRSPMPAAGPAALLSQRPMRFLGRISYSLYLWHWPFLVLPAAYLDTDLDLPWRLLLVAAAVGAAALTQRLVEDPIRRGRFVGLASRRSLAMAGTLSLAVALAATGANAVAATRLISHGPQVGGSITDVPLPTEPALVAATEAPSAPPTAAASAAPLSPSAIPSLPPPSPTPSPRLPRPPGGPLPGDLAPSLADAATDLPVIYADGCHVDLPTTVPPVCVFGRATSSVTVVLFGDSHAAQWFPALQRLATAHAWRLEPITKSACTPASVTVWNPVINRAYTECDQWRTAALARIAAERPALVIVSTSRAYQLVAGGQSVSAQSRPDVWGRALTTTMRALTASAANVVLLGDTPRSVVDPPECLSEHMNNVNVCAVPYDQAVDQGQIALEAGVAARVAADFVDPTSWVCRTDPCPAVFGRFLIYRDQGHLTRTYAAALASQLFGQLPVIGP